MNQVIFDRIWNDSIGPNCVVLVFLFSYNIDMFWYILSLVHSLQE
jgi:hypothetical protein